MTPKILIITPGFWPLFGGMEEQCRLLAKSFIDLGYGVDILTEQTLPEFKEKEKFEGINIFRLRYVECRNWWAFVNLFIGIISFIYKKSDKYDFCIIRTFTFPCLVVGLLKLFGLKLKTIVTAETGGENDDVIALKKSRLWRVLVFLAGRHDYHNAICEDNVKHFDVLGFDKKKLTRIYNGIDVGDYYELKYPKRIKSFLFLARLLGTKGLFELVEAFKIVSQKRPNVRLYVGGDGTDKEIFLQSIKGYEDKIIYKGFVKKEEKNDFFDLGECLVLPSYSEGFPISILEAVAKKKVVIVTDVSDLKSLFGKNMLFCKKKNITDLAKKMLLVIDKARPFVLNYDKVIEKVDIKKVVLNYRNLFS